MRVTVFGSARVLPGSAEYGDGVRLGMLLAARGDVVVTGGYGGIMEAVSRGAREQHGTVVGVTVAPWRERLTPNEFVDEERSADTLFQRLEALVESDALIALPGGAGTLAEIALAWNLRQMALMPDKPVILVGADWRALVAEMRQHLIIGDRDLEFLTLVETIEQAVEALAVEDEALHDSHWFG